MGRQQYIVDVMLGVWTCVGNILLCDNKTWNNMCEENADNISVQVENTVQHYMSA